LNDRQRAALRFLMEHAKLTVRDFETLCPGVNRRSLQRDLAKLLELRLIATSGATNLLEYKLL